VPERSSDPVPDPDTFSMLADASDRGRAGLVGLLSDPARTVVALDYDGTLAPIVDDPTRAVPAAGAVDALAALTGVVGHVVVLTGRPAADIARLLDLDNRADLGRLLVLGQYGAERRDGASGQISRPDPPSSLVAVRRAIPALLEQAAAANAYVEDKGLAVAVHLRRLPDAQPAFDRVVGPLTTLGEAHGLRVEPGRLVVELRAPGSDKGLALAALLSEVEARTVVVVGDDLGDVAAFEAADRFRAVDGQAGLLVCSGSAEVTALAERADLVVDGPVGVVALIGELVARFAALDG
jgi:trehalose 6-phosphate phosphatase